MKNIGLTLNVDYQKIREERRDTIDQKWIDFVLHMGGNPILLSNNDNTLKSLKNLDGIILTGGNSLVSLGGDAPERDRIENLILDYAVASHMPVMGVCRGMQLIQAYWGNTLYPVSNHINQYHDITFLGEKRTVNSFHSYGTTILKNKELQVIGTSFDGVIEAIQHHILPIKAIMWHPEREKKSQESDLSFFKKSLAL